MSIRGKIFLNNGIVSFFQRLIDLPAPDGIPPILFMENKPKTGVLLSYFNRPTRYRAHHRVRRTIVYLEYTR